MNTFRFDLKAREKTVNSLTTSRGKSSLSGALSLFTPKLQKLFAILVLLPLVAVYIQGGQRSQYGLPEQNRAIYLGWQGYVDTQLDFSQFFHADHTIMAWFMPQYPYAYEGPIFAENGDGTYVIGQGDYRDGDGGYKDAGNPVFLIQIGDKKAQYLVPEFNESSLKVHPWVHIAVVRHNNIFDLYINGAQRWPVKNIDKETNTFTWGSRIDASSISPPSLPSGTLRFGRRTSLPPIIPRGTPEAVIAPRRDWQAFGLLDDVAVFNEALTYLEIPAIKNQKRLSGSEAGLLAGWCFDKPALDEKPLPPKLNSWWDPSPRAYRVPVSADRNSDSDDWHFGNPFIIGETQVALKLPIPVNEEWYVIQGYNARGGSHNGYAAFCYDFKLYNDTGPNYPNGTAYAPVQISSPGKVVLYGNGAVILKQAAGEYTTYMHLAANSLSTAISGGTYDADIGYYIIPENQAPYFQQSSQIAEVDPTAYHLHWAGKGGLLTQTIPMAFSNYDVWDTQSQSWVHVLRGHPKAGQRIRRLQ